MYGCIGIVVYGLFLIVARAGIENYFKTFSVEKWSNPDWYGLRHFMVNDLERKYVLVGSSEEEVMELLGNSEVEGECQIRKEEIRPVISLNTHSRKRYTIAFILTRTGLLQR